MKILTFAHYDKKGIVTISATPNKNCTRLLKIDKNFIRNHDRFYLTHKNFEVRQAWRIIRENLLNVMNDEEELNLALTDYFFTVGTATTNNRA